MVGLSASFYGTLAIEICDLLSCSGYGYGLTILNNAFLRQWLNHQHKCYCCLKFKHTCMQKSGMNHQRKLWEQMVSSRCVVRDCLLALILIRSSFTWCEKSNLLQTSSISWLLINLHYYLLRVGWLLLS